MGTFASLSSGHRGSASRPGRRRRRTSRSPLNEDRPAVAPCRVDKDRGAFLTRKRSRRALNSAAVGEIVCGLARGAAGRRPPDRCRVGGIGELEQLGIGEAFALRLQIQP